MMKPAEETSPSPTHVILEIMAESERTRRQRILHRVPPQVRENKKHIYDPVVLSLGPYHDHGQPQFRQLEELKDEVLDIICGANDKTLFHCKILERIDEIRNFYGGVSKVEYKDEALAEMMLRDACFILYYMKMTVEKDDAEKLFHILRRLGMSGVAFMYRDIYMLENQIPLWLIKLLIALTSHDDDDRSNGGESLLYNFLSLRSFGDRRLTRVPWENNEEEPLHLLEALGTTVIKEDKTSTSVEPIKNHRRHWIFKTRWPRRRKSSEIISFERVNSQFRSVTELKAKGIHFRPSSNCLRDIRFNSFSFYGELRLPIRFINNNSKVFFSNVIALEMSPETRPNFVVTSYVDFMKSLIESPEDVKELRRQGILFSVLANDEGVVRMFKEIDTYGIQNLDIFLGVKKRIEEHCNSRAKTWMAELIYTYFRTPWTATALFAATFLLCLTFLQTYYTMNPRNGGNN